MRWITAKEITKWADKNPRQCQEKLPELVRMLLRATAPSIQRIDFPCDSSVTTGGWDGQLETSSQYPFFPEGISRWEIGTDKSPGKKADADYKNRKKNPLGAKPKETTYVAVTVREWPKRSEWESKKRADGHWKNVRAIGVDELELWLASASGVGTWFARLIGKATPGYRHIQTVWDEWSIYAKPALTPDIVIAGRTKESEEIQKWISGPASLYQTQGDSSDEPIAFLYASIANLPEDQRDAALSRCIAIDTLQDLRACYDSSTSPLIIAVTAECLDGAPMAVSKGHHVLLVRDANTIDRSNIHRLSRPQRDPLRKALQAAGMSEADAQKYARDSGLSIPVLRRHLFRAGRGKDPAWAEASSASILLPSLLAGAWVEGKEGDIEMIEALADADYKVFLKGLTQFASVDDAPVRKVGNVWMLKSPLDAWFLVARHLDQGHLTRFRKAINAVLTETNPKYDLPPDQRWAAGVYGKTSKNSEWIRRGLVESLVLLAVYGERISSAIDNPQDFADAVVKDVLENANSWQAWASVKDVLPLLAEAAPDGFLDCLEEKIQQNPSLFADLMRDEQDRFGLGDCQHSGLLWALEGIVWHPDYMIRATGALLSLAEIDPGGRWSNRPVSSLTDVFMAGVPQTHATPEQRLAAYDMVIERNPRIAWKIAESLMDSRSFSASHMFRWRDSGGTRGPFEGESRNNYLKYGQGLLPRWADLACATHENLTSAVEHFLRLEDGVRDKVLTSLKKVKASSFTKEERKALLHNLRYILNWINNYGEAKHKESLPILKKAYKALTPKDTLERVEWLFVDGWPRLPDEPQASKSHEQRLVEVRKKAARDLLDDLPLTEVLDYGQTLSYQAIFTHAIATAVKDKREDSKLVDALAERAIKTPWLLVGYSMGRIEGVGERWVMEQATRLKKNPNYSPEAIGALFRGMPEKGPTWAAVAEYGSDVEQAYWKLASGYTRAEEGKKTEDSATAIDKLLMVGRPEIAINIAGDPHISLPSELLRRVLLDLLRLDADRKKHLDGTMLEFHLTNIFNQLYERKELSLDEIGNLEWPYAQIFDRFNKRTNGPMALHRKLQSNPAFFIELISFLYKKDDGKTNRPEGLTEKQAETVAENAREILETWYLIPGIEEDGSVNAKKLDDWIDEARKLAETKQYLKGCDLKLAEVLSRIPQDKDGMWPDKALRQTIERIKSRMLDEHIPYAIYNSRGVRTRSIGEGGQQERVLSETYEKWSKAMRSKWPRTSKILHSLAEMLDRDARREDIDSELQDLEN